MQNKSYFPVLLILSIQTSYAGRIMGDQDKKDIKECVQKMSAIKQKFKSVQQSPEALCEDFLWRSRINEETKQFEKCLTLAEKYPTDAGAMDVCFANDVRRLSERKDYESCLEKVQGYKLGRKQFLVCTDPLVTETIGSPNFNGCYQYLTKSLELDDSAYSFNVCKDSRLSKTMESGQFKDCVSVLKRLGGALRDSINYCLMPQNQDPRHLKELESCSEGIGDLTGQKGISYCSNMRDTLYLVQNKNIQCAEDKIKKFLDVSYFRDENLSNATELLRQFIYDCDRPYMRSYPIRNKNAEFISLKVLGSQKEFKGTRVGGLSALALDKKTNTLIALSDDPGATKSNSRFYQLDPANLQFTGHRIIDTYVEQKKDKAEDQEDPNKSKRPPGKLFYNIDAEGIALLPNSTLAISSETLLPGSNIFLRLYSIDGQQKAEIPLPDKFIPLVEEKEFEQKFFDSFEEKDGPVRTIKPVERKKVVKKVVQTKGVFPNKAFEALTSIPGKSILLTANEHPLVQDHMEDRRFVRITRLNGDAKGTFSPGEEFAYELEPGDGNGLVEMAAIDDNRVLVLERAYDRRIGRITARIYEVNLATGKDYSETFSFIEERKKNKIVTLDKKLLIDLSDIETLLPTGIDRIDNFEGMVLGPKLANGRYRLTLVTDNNFAPNQLMQVLTLEVTL